MISNSHPARKKVCTHVDICVGRELLSGSLRKASVSVSTEVITLSLEEGSRELSSPVAIEEGESSGESRCRDSRDGSLSHNSSPAWLSLVDSLVEEIIEEQVLESWVLAVSIGDVAEEDAVELHN
jgi:hypothetical protein